MPKMDGLAATRKIMETDPTPIVIVSGMWDTKEVETTFRAMEAGALAGVQRPMGIGHPEHEAAVKELVQTVKLMSEVKVVKRWATAPKKTIHPASPRAKSEPKQILPEIKIVAIGASTGGPPVLQKILSGLPKDFPVPVLIVQHMPYGFIHGMAEWLGQSTGFPVHVAVRGEYLFPGLVYVAPYGFHMKVEIGNKIALIKDNNPDSSLCPSVSSLFYSVAQVFGQNAVGVLLTGMGKDGAKELKLMREKGAVTIAQDAKSSVVHGMPGEAIKIGAATHVLSADEIATFLKLINKKKEQKKSYF